MLLRGDIEPPRSGVKTAIEQKRCDGLGSIVSDVLDEIGDPEAWIPLDDADEETNLAVQYRKGLGSDDAACSEDVSQTRIFPTNDPGVCTDMGIPTSPRNLSFDAIE